ncbi:MAG: ScyD/ScyE family protein [Chloroflexia bacterium]|nr:ScyD/ScyE family protein [Chloroflexia bacterium]
MRRRIFVHLLPICLVCFGLMALAPLSSATQEATPVTPLPDGVTVVANGLTNPRGFTWTDDGTLHLALAGTGGEEQIVVEATPYPFYGGETSSIVTVADGCTSPVIDGLPSGYWSDPGWTWGIMDVVVFNDELYALSGGGSASWGNPVSPNGIYRILQDGTWELVVDLGTWNSENPPVFIPWDYDPNGSWFDLEAGTDRLWVTEAVGGRLLTVTPDGQIEEVADLSVDHMVPTGIALDDESGAYVTFETVVPFPDGASKVVHITADGTVTDHWTGLTAVTDLVMGPDGVLYAAEMATNNSDDPPYLNPGTGRIVRQTGPDSLEAVVTGIDYPVYLGFADDGSLYVSGPAFGDDRGEGLGILMQIDLAAAPVLVVGITDAAPTCGDSSTAAGSPAASGAEVAMAIQEFAFEQPTLEIRAGTTVVWTNNDGTPHTVTSTDGLFDSGRMDEGGVFSQTFDAAGEYPYLCAYHPGMQGTIIVT